MTGPSHWADTFTPGASVLLIDNTSASPADELERVVKALEQSTGFDSLWVMARPATREWLVDRGVDRSRILTATVAGLEIEFDDFLSRPTTVRWAARCRCDLVLGAEPYPPSNQDPKLVFERRVAPMLGRGRFVVHSLPDDRTLLLSADHLWHRAARPEAIEGHRRRVKGALDNLHAAWSAGANPPSVGELLAPHPPAEAAESALFNDARDYAYERLRSALLVDEYTAPVSDLRILVDPPGLVPPTGWVVDWLRPFGKEFVSPQVDSHGSTLVAKGDIGGPYSYIFRSLPLDLAEGDTALAQGILECGGVSMGLVGVDGQWVRRVDIDYPGAFLAATVAPTSGRYAFVIANCARGADHSVGLALTRFGLATTDPGNADDGFFRPLVEAAQEISRRDVLLTELRDQRARDVQVRDEIIANISEERRQAVSERDLIIDRLHQELGRLTAGWRRLVVGRPRI